MKKVVLAGVGLLMTGIAPAFARGVTPYLPLNLDPETERQIERVLVLADKPVLTRPIAAATVLDALPKACERDAALCAAVRRYLGRFMGNWGIVHAGVEGFASGGDEAHTIPNRYGQRVGSPWAASAGGFWQPSDYALLALAGVAYEGEANPTGSVLSLGFDFAQLDIGYRPHWFSPARDNSMLISTHAETMPSITLSNYQPLTRFGLQYELFVASMSKSNTIVFNGAPASGNPRLAGVHLSMEPASGWALGVNRLMQYGGGPRPGSFSDLVRAFFDPARYDNANGLPGGEEFGNQVASVTSAFVFPGKVPFSVYFEHAGEDTSDLKAYLLGNAALTAGIHFPRLWQAFELTYEIAEWQNAWYVSGAYGDGLRNEGHVIGHWGGDEREFTSDVGARSQTLRIGWQPKFGGQIDFRLSTLTNELYSGVPYKRAYDGTLRYSRAVGQFTAGVELLAGRDVFGSSFRSFGTFVSYAGDQSLATSNFLADEEGGVDETAEVFVEAGVSANKTLIESDQDVFMTHRNTGAHLALGARRAVSDNSDLGVRIELDDVDGHTLMSVRALDYRFRFANPLALSVFVGASRYDLATPAFGLYFGGGLQWRNVMPGWDVGLDVRQAKKVARDHLLPSDPQSLIRPDSFYTIDSFSLSLSKRF